MWKLYSWETFYEKSLFYLSSKRTQGHHGNDMKDENPGDGAHDDVDDDSEEDGGDGDSDPGTSWFTEHNAPTKVLEFLTSPTFPLAPCNTNTTNTNITGTVTSPPPPPPPIPVNGSNNHNNFSSPSQPSILDLGTGNGSMLSLLRNGNDDDSEGGFTGPMVGVDYSDKSIELARRLHPRDEIRFEAWNVFEGDDEGVVHVHVHDKESEGDRRERRRPDWLPPDGFDIVLDKGTFDAVSLSADVLPDGRDGNQNDQSKGKSRRICERYPAIVTKLVKMGGFLIITSCNWTEEELIKWFTKDNNDSLAVWGKVEYPKFRFGGREGQGVCTICFQRKGH